MPHELLPDRAVLSISGSEHRHFLQNLVTCDVEKLQDGEASFGALLTPQGKILFDFLVVARGDDLWLDTEAERADDLAKRLAFYKLRADVTVERLDVALSVIWDEDNGEGAPDPRHSALGSRIYADGDAKLGDRWQRLRIGLGIPQLGADYLPETTFPHEALMDQFGPAGVDFSKGCYVGQEVVSRMQHRGTARSRFVKVAGDRALPPQGTDIRAGDRSIGTMGSSQGSDGLAIVRLDRTAAAMADGVEVTAGDATIKTSLPDFVSFDWPNA